MTTMIGGLTLGQVNLVVVLVILGAAFLVVVAAGFWRMMYGEPPTLIREPSQEQVDYMRGVRYRNQVNLYHTAKEMRYDRNSKETTELSSMA